MDHRATKDHYEQEQDEAARLVRPAPKVKPPRRDLRREDVQERDPDVAGDPDLSGDPDMSLNYKSVGGSVLAHRVAFRHVFAIEFDTKDERDTYLTEHPKADPSKHSVKPEGEDEKPEEPEPGASKAVVFDDDGETRDATPEEQEHAHAKRQKAKDPEAFLDNAGQDVFNRVKSNPQLVGFLSTIVDPSILGKVQDDKRLDSIKGAPLDQLPKGIETMGELRKVIDLAGGMTTLKKRVHLPKKKRVDTEEPPAAPKPAPKPESAKPAPKKDEEKPLPNIPDLDVPGEAGSKKHKPPTLPTVEPVPSEDKAEGKGSEGQEDSGAQETVPPKAEAETPAKPKEQKEEGSPPASPPDAAPGDVSAPDKPSEEDEKPSTTKTKPFKPKDDEDEFGLGAKGEPKLSPKDTEEVAAWLKAKGDAAPDFKSFATKDKTVRTDDETGEQLFPDPRRKGKRVPFSELPGKSKLDWKRRFDESKGKADRTKALQDLAAKDPAVSQMLDELANPDSQLSRQLSKEKDPELVAPEAVIPGLKGKIPKSIENLAQLQELAVALRRPLDRPLREPPTPEEEEEARNLIYTSNLSPEAQADILTAGLHPKDVKSFIGAFEKARESDIPDDVDEFAKGVSQFYATNPNRVRNPAKWKNAAGQTVPFEDLSPVEQQEAALQHQLQTVALSMAARDKIKERLEESGVPATLGDRVSDFMLSTGKMTPEQKEHAANQMADQFFTQTIEDGINPDQDKHEGINKKTPEKVFKSLKDPAARKLAVAYFQGRDYQLAKDKFTDPDSPNSISEHSTPTTIAQTLKDADKFFEEQGEKYPHDAVVRNPAQIFRVRFLSRLHDVAPEVFDRVRAHTDKAEAEDYEAAKKKYDKVKAQREKLLQGHEEAKKKHEADSATYSQRGKSGPYRDVVEKPSSPKEPDLPDLPKEPEKPARYDVTRGNRKDIKKGIDDLWRDQFEHTGIKKAARIAGRFLCFSSYPTQTSMDRHSVYHGVAPYPPGHEGFAPYVPWTQAHQRDFGPADVDALLLAANEWLKTPVLSTAVEGIVRDTQLRAALDLAFWSFEDGRYSAGVHPDIYNAMLADLAGWPEEQTLLTIREASKRTRKAVDQYLTEKRKSAGEVAPDHRINPKSICTPSQGEVSSMKASVEIRKFAAKTASTDPTLAYELVDLANKLAESEPVAGQVPPQFLEHMKGKKDDKGDQGQGQQDQGDKQAAAAYRSLRAAVIKAASQNPAARAAFTPVLTLVKQLG